MSDFLKQHKENYKNIIRDLIVNNTNILVNQDLSSLLRTPPLDSMDLIKNKLLSLAKKNKVVLNTDCLCSLMNNFRDGLLSCCEEIENIRNKELLSTVKKHKIIKDTDIIKLNKKDFNGINKAIKNILKDSFISMFENRLINNIDEVFSSDISIDLKNKIIDDFSKYVKGSYKKQLFENIDIKILIKDVTLINAVKEQGERYLFTLNNSRLLKDI